MIAPVLIAAALSGPVAERIAVERFLGEMGKLRTDVKTLRVTFTLTRTDAVFRKSTITNGTFTVLNGGDTIYAALRLEPAEDPKGVETWVLRGNDLVCYAAPDKTICKFTVPQGGALRYVADYWHAAVWLLDSKEARKRCDVRLTKRDEWYNYFTVKVTQPPLLGLYFDRPAPAEECEYRVAVALVASDTMPARVIRQIGITKPNSDSQVFRIKSWARDEHNLTPKHFPDPATPPEGWKVVEPPARPKP